MESSPLNVVLVATYPPTQCGLATYTANLRAVLARAGARARVVRILDRAEDNASFALEVAAIWVKSDLRGIETVIPLVDDCDLVMVQHEFGIYPGRDGDQVVELVRRCARPVITVLHTVLAHPDCHQAAIIDALAEASAKLVVHSDAARCRLLSVHDIDPSKVEVIPHGASPNLTGSPNISALEPLLLTWGLLGPGKGIEHGIEAVALLREQGLDVRYLVAGQTHPNVRSRDGEQYRDMLHTLARARGVGDLVFFDGAYHDWPSLRAIVRSASLVLVPYDSRDQVTSGVLVEALAAGKPVVATAFPHAVELSRTGAVAVVDHKAPRQCARTIRRILAHPCRRTMMENAARAEGKRYDWATVGGQYLALAEAVMLQRSNLAMTI